MTSPMDDDERTPAPPGYVYQCAACGKRARTRCGLDAENRRTAVDRGYDEACMMNAELVRESLS